MSTADFPLHRSNITTPQNTSTLAVGNTKTHFSSTQDNQSSIFHIIKSKIAAVYLNFPQILGLILTCLSVFVFIRSISPTFRLWTKWSQKIDLFIFHLPDNSLAWAVVLAILAGAVSRRKKIAWLTLLLYFILFFVINLVALLKLKPQDKRFLDKTFPHLTIKIHENAYHTHFITLLLVLSIQSGIILLLLLTHKQFYAKVQKANILLALLVYIVGMCISALIGNLLLIKIDAGYSRTEQFIFLVTQSMGISRGFREHGFLHGEQNTHARHVLFLLSFFGAITYIITVIVLLRSQRSHNAMTLSDETVVRRLNEAFGTQDSLSYYATRRDKAIVWAPNARAAITYRVELGVCVASADPIGEEKSWNNAIDAWLKLCDEFGWLPAVEGASTLGATYYCQAGLKSWALGDEALIYPDTFTLSGPARRDIRQSVSRAKRNRLEIRIRRQEELSYEEINQIIHHAQTWRHDKQERGFSMALGRLGDPADGATLIVEAIQKTDNGQQIVGMLSFVPWGTSGVSLDLMRRSPHTPNGTIEFMITELALHAQEFGIHKISLNFVMLRKVFSEGPQLGSGPVLKIWYSILKYFSRFWQLETLYHSTSKFSPEWFPRFVCYPHTHSMLKVGFAIATAEGFVRFPRILSQKNLAKKHTGIFPKVPSAALEENFLNDVEQDKDKILTPKRPNQVEVRLTKLHNALEKGIDPYPVGTEPTHSIEQARKVSIETQVSVAGRIMRIRSFGGVIFGDLHDWSHSIQILLESPLTTNFRKLVDLGDIIEVTGSIGHSRKGELSILVTSWVLQAKSLHPLPDKYKGLVDPEIKVKLRHVDLLTSSNTRNMVTARNSIVKSVRKILDDSGFVEVETPILQNIHGGANATPFITRINAYHLDLYLRIAPELYLKRLIVGGLPKIYELGKQFRNEGADSTHNPEFTSLEVYEAYGDYFSMKTLVQDLIFSAVLSVHDKKILLYRDQEIDISQPWPTISVLDAISAVLGEEISLDDPSKKLQNYCKKRNIVYNSLWDKGKLINRLYEQLIEKTTFLPTFYTDFPISVSPLTRNHRSKPGLAERWDLVIFGMELATAYTELTDPIQQRKRLTEQSLLAAHGDKESMQIDEDFLTALEYAMPPTGGLGMGIDRLVMLITGKSIRETLLFPFTR